jgi:2-keto-4-pentenoate hydratase/2-oxohepta-3-ene-1,7-dioic acid hydratase in catechol pathway
VMRVARIKTPSSSIYARLEGDHAIPLAGAPWLGTRGDAGMAIRWADADLLCPIEPTKIIGFGRNYAALSIALGKKVPTEPILFLKPPSSLVGPGAIVELPAEGAEVEHEAELGVVIGTSAKNLSLLDAHKAIFGYTIVNDITARDLQKKDGQWCRAKGFDTFCPAGPWIETDLAAEDLAIQCRVNGMLRQDGRTSSMIFSISTLLVYASRIMTLEPGDLIMTGTPAGVGPLAHGDVCEITVGGIGTLLVTVRGLSETPLTARRDPAG